MFAMFLFLYFSLPFTAHTCSRMSVVKISNIIFIKHLGAVPLAFFEQSAAQQPIWAFMFAHRQVGAIA